MEKGIAIAGYTGVDIIKEVSAIPAPHDLVNILSVELALGGIVNNCGRSLALLAPDLPVKLFARIGTDAYGDEILKRLSRYPNICTENVRRVGLTSYTDVLSDARTKVRSFLTFEGASGEFCEADIDFNALDCKIFHAGYILLSRSLDAPDAEYGTKMARLLKRVQEKGIRTSVDAITDSSGRHRTLMPPAMRYTDILCVNEHEAAAATGIPLRAADGTLIYQNIEKVLLEFKKLGVKRWAAIHAPEGGFGLDENGAYRAVAGAVLPDGFIAGTVGAGDAFTSGLLLGAYRGVKIEDALAYGIAAAVCSLRAADASEGVCPLDEALNVLGGLPRYDFAGK